MNNDVNSTIVDLSTWEVPMFEVIYKTANFGEYQKVKELFENQEDYVCVTRCKDCRFNYGIANGEEFNADDILCTYFETDGMTANDYCSHAERKEHD